MVRTVNMELINRICYEAANRKIQFKMNAIQRGTMIEFVALLRNGTGDEMRAQVHVDVDDVANVVYVTIAAEEKDICKDLREKIYNIDGITQIDYDTIIGKKMPGVRYVYGEYRYVNTGTYDAMASAVMDKVEEVLQVMSKVLY